MPELTATCHCQAVSITVPRRPRSITNCNCSMCRRYGTLWGYYKLSTVRLLAPEGGLDEYQWGDKWLTFKRCGHCGCVMCWMPVNPRPDARMGVNMRNAMPEALGDVRIRKLDGAKTWKYVE